MRIAALLAILLPDVLVLASSVKPATQTSLRVLIVSGGGYHDYILQRDILEKGLKARLNLQVSHSFSNPRSNQETRPAIPAFRNPAYGDGYDLIIHNECAADESDPFVLSTMLAPHLKGTPAVNLHCAMHSFRSGEWNKQVDPGAENARWFALTGIQSSGHGPQAPIRLRFADHPITKGMRPWTTPDEELYNNLTQFDVTPVVMGTQLNTVDARWRGPMTVAWTHLYGPKQARVFSLTLAHNEGTMADPRYLDLVARGVAWASGHLNNDGSLGAEIRPRTQPR